MASRYFGKDGFIWWKGVVEDRKDPLLLGRTKVRIFGWHTQDKTEIPTEDLPWALYIAPPDDGQNVPGFKEGDWVVGFFLDGKEAQRPCIIGKIHGIPEDESNPDVGFNDPTPDENLTCGLQPRPPEMCPPPVSEEGSSSTFGKFSNPEKLPGNTTAFGMLISEILGPKLNPKNYKFDVNADGEYNQEDADLIAWDFNRDGKLSPNEERNKNTLNFNKFLGFESVQNFSIPISRYPLIHKLNEPTISRLARNEKIEQTIVGIKKGQTAFGKSAGFNFLTKDKPEGSTSIGSEENKLKIRMAGSEVIKIEEFEEPETPYNAVYPFNHVYESESGHVIEIDDTPGFERLHRYHRSGTFEEIHPNGLRVDKTVNDHYNMVTNNFFNHSGQHSRMTADEDFKIKAGKIMVLQSGDSFNLDVGSNANVKITEDGNILVGGTVRLLIEGSCHMHVAKDMSIYTEGNFHLNSDKDVKIVSGGTCEIVSGGLTSIPKGNVEVAKFANESNFATTLGGAGAEPDFPEASEVEDDTETIEEPEDTTIQAGFILDQPKAGDLYKPESESDGNLVCLSNSPEQIKLYHAIPTGELEEVTIRYLHEDLSITEWKVVRPVHVFEESGLIEAGVSSGFLGGRSVWRFSKPGKEYPKQMIMVTGSKPDGWLILDSSIRHD